MLHVLLTCLCFVYLHVKLQYDEISGPSYICLLKDFAYRSAFFFTRIYEYVDHARHVHSHRETERGQ